MNKIDWKGRCISAEKILKEVENMETWLPDGYSEPVAEDRKEELVKKIARHRLVFGASRRKCESKPINFKIRMP